MNNAETFFTQQPRLRGLAPRDIAGGYILTIAIGGAKLPAGAPVEVTVNVGFGKTVEPFTFNAVPPPAPPAPGQQ